ncbi:hypothetical protein Tco_0902836 [Tanacetum coccineum]
MVSQDARLSKFEADFKQQQSEMTNKIDTVLKAITDRIMGALPSDTVKNPKPNVNSTSLKVRRLNSFLESFGLVPRSLDTKFVCTKEDDEDVMFIEIIKKYDYSHEELEVEVNAIIEGVVRFTDGINEIAYKMSHKIEQYDSLSNLEKDHMKLVYLRNKEDKRRGVEYVMNKILGFYKECLEL